MSLDLLQRRLLVLFLLLYPLYLFPSGVPQISHLLLAVACVAGAGALLTLPISPDRGVLAPLLLLAVYTVLVNAYHSAVQPWTSIRDLPLARSAHFFFNYAVFAVFLWRLRRGGWEELRTYIAALVLTVIALAVVSLLYPIEERGRLVAFFNNPNQLGYFSVTALVAGFAFALGGGMSMPVAGLFTAAGIYLTLDSLSIASTAAVGLLVLLVAVRAAGSVRPLAMALALAVLPLLAAAWLAQGDALFRSVIERSGRVNYLVRHFAEHRRLNWLTDHPHYLVLGAGQGAAQRFTDRPNDISLEVHSTFATLLFSYGIPGTLLFCVFLWRAARANPARSLPLIVPMLVYGLAHNGLRFSMFWFAMAVVYYTARPVAGIGRPLTLWPARERWRRSAP